MQLGRPLPLGGVKITDPFWSYWQNTVIDHSLPQQWQMCEETGRIENFRRVVRGELDGHEGMYYNDSDVYKWMEAAAYALRIRPDSPTAPQLKEAIDLIGQAQHESGYINTYHQLGRMDEQYKSLVCKHEMYCGGHLIEAAVAHEEATGDKTLSTIARKYADHIAATFGPDKRKGWCGHQEIELALCRLADLDQDESRRDLARWMTEGRGTRPSPYWEELQDEASRELSPGYYERMIGKDGTYDGSYCQDDKPLTEQDLPVGHSVRAMYYYIGAHESYGAEMPEKLGAALKRIWQSLIEKRIYITGGIGSSRFNEGFTEDYDLPNRDAYAETCAAISLFQWASRMNDLMGDTEPADVMERILYNAALSGIALDGVKYYYVNPLERVGMHERMKWYTCACCPPNIARLILSLGQYLGRVSEDTLTINLYVGADLKLNFGGESVSLRIESDLPWEPRTRVVVAEGSANFKLRLRIPAWADETVQVRRNGARIEAEIKNGYITLNGQWSPGDIVDLDFKMEPTYFLADPRVVDAGGRAALVRGPLLFCLEDADNPHPISHFAVDTLVPVKVKECSPLPTVQRVAEVSGRVIPHHPSGSSLYFHAADTGSKADTATMIPYYAWANRGPGKMKVWMRRA